MILDIASSDPAKREETIRDSATWLRNRLKLVEEERA